MRVKVKQENPERPETLRELAAAVQKDFGEMLRLNVYTEPVFGEEKGVYRGREEEVRRIRQREKLRRALRRSGTGDENAKAYIKGCIKELLLKKYSADEGWVAGLYPFDNGRNCFAGLLQDYRRIYGKAAVLRLFADHHLAERKLQVTEKDIFRVWQSVGKHPNFPEYLELLTQRIYEDYKGNGAADELFGQELDGISGGVSGGRLSDAAERPTGMKIAGHPNTADLRGMADRAGGESAPGCVWIMYRGRTVSLDFLPLSGGELERICRNLCRGNQMGQISERNGYLITEGNDGSRISVARPPFCESWVFFLRKFHFGSFRSLPELVNGNGSEEVIRLLHWLVRGERLLAVTGEQGAGKTTLLAALVGEIPEHYNLRVQELAFELQLRRRYPGRNVVSFRETGSISGQEGLDFAKKTDGAVTILGEVASAPVVRFLIQLSQNASAFTMFTHHARTTETLLFYLRNSLLQEGGFRNEQIALEQAASAVQFDIHLAKNSAGIRFIERITEVRRKGDSFEFRNIMERHENEYFLANSVSRESIKAMGRVMEREEEREFLRDAERWWGYRGQLY